MKKGSLVLICLTAAFICILLGIYIGRNANHSLIITAVNAPVSTIPKNNGRININEVTASQLQQLPGIGEVTAQNIIDYREKNGPFTTADELLNVEGVGDVRLKELLEYIYIPN